MTKIIILSVFLCIVFSINAQAQSLNDFIELTINSHPAMQSQRNQMDVAQADREVARQQFLPTPSVNVENKAWSNKSANSPTNNGDDTVLVLRLQQPLWTGGRLTAGLDKADAQISVTAAALLETRQQLALRTIQAWGEWYGADLKVQAMERSLAEHQRLKEQVQRRVEAGASGPNEQVLTDGRVDQTRSQLEAYKGLLQMARMKLALLTGRPLAREARPSQVLKFSPPGMELVQDKVRAASPSIQKLEAQIKVQEAEVDERKSDLMPEVFLRAEHQHGNATYSNVPDSDAVFVGVSTKLGAGFSSLSRIESSRKRLQAANAEREATERAVLEQFQGDWVQYHTLRARIPALEASLTSTRLTAEAWDRQFLAGRKSWLEVMNTTRELAQAEIELADAKAALVQTEWRLAVLSDGVDEVLRGNAQSASIRR
ncbi:TolC family protein [Dechloromonas sp. HYN0024]|uniref:TolC family protein n=1 Tax=Dechloromonas sp. HYN0024 TaxID=2231055 RepID=UPI000E42ECE8|nr:TolC family protein [Dechloromonas sp. HYN0024]AXS80351.1 TolC family protein [Dechloromonas sp. HYN0024]